MKNSMSFTAIIRFGLACVFLANSLMAFLSPNEFQSLVANSFLAAFLPISVAAFVTLVGLNDLIVAVLLISGWRTPRVAAYATLWIMGVVFVIGAFTFDSFEHLGYISMAYALARFSRD
jgi:hypothetical protein